MNKKQDYIDKFIGLCEPGTILVSEYKNAVTKITLKCPEGHLRSVTSNGIVSRGSGTTCKECQGLSATGHKQTWKVAEELLTFGYVLLEEYKGALNKVLCKNSACGHEYLIVPSSILRGRRTVCPVCSPSRRTGYTAEDFEKEVAKLGLTVEEPYTSMKSNISVTNNSCGHSYSINPGHLLYDNIGINCFVCTGLNPNTIKNRFFSELIKNNSTLESEYIRTQDTVSIKNNNCGHVYTTLPNNYVTQGSGVICRICYPEVKVSKPEKDILEYVQSIYSGWIIQSDRTILEGKELDIVLPDLGIAIEYDGARWHSNMSVPSTYHNNKTIKTEEFGYQLIHIFEEEWLSKPDIVKSRLANLIGGPVSVIYARNTEVREIPFPAKFLNDNHIQGAGSISKYNYGLFHNDILVAVMTFSAPRFDSIRSWELVRFCALINTRVVGGASKLLKAFTSVHGKNIVSYSDRRWSQGKLYQAMGFSLSHTSKPNYRYYKGKIVLSRYKCQKHLLPKLLPKYYKEELSETEIMMEAGYYKVYDCGNDVWVLT